MKKAGLDIGNYAVKLWVNENEKPLQIPTVISLYTGETVDLLEQPDIAKHEIPNNIDVTIYSKALRQNGIRYIVGNKVIEDVLDAEELENHSDKSSDEITAVLGLASLAVDAIMENYDSNDITVTYDIALSLPVSTITVKTAELYANRFIGHHEVIYHHPSGRNQKVNLNIEFARTLPEGSAGSWGIIFNEDGTLKKWTIKDGDNEITKTLEDDVLLHFDIGAGTTEEVVTDGVVYRPQHSYGHDFGVKQTIEDIRKQFNSVAKPNEKIDSVTEFNTIYFDKENPRHDKLVALSKPHLNKLARKMAKIIINKIDSLKARPVTFIYGGGSIVLEEYLREELQAKDRMDRVVFLNDPINVTAKGLLVYATSPRYLAKKEEVLGVKDGSKTI